MKSYESSSNKTHEKPKILIMKSTYHNLTRHVAHNKTQYGRLMIVLLLSIIGTLFINHTPSTASEIQEGIAKEIIRFHVLANSDSTADQALKLKVKDALVSALSPKLKETKSMQEARSIIEENHINLLQIAKDEITKQGYSYDVVISLEPTFFPLKKYGDFVFPAGTYEALRVQIGEAKGQNWWCVMFPPLCFVDETYTIVDENSEDQLKHLLTEEEYTALRNNKIPTRIRFKLFDKIKGLLSSKK